MIKAIVNRLIAGAVAAAAALVAVFALGATIFYALCLVLTPLLASAATAGIFALVAIIAYLVFADKAGGDNDDDDEEDDTPDSLPGRILHMVQQRPVIGVVAALAAGAVLLRKPGLAALALTAFNESGDDRRKDRKRSRRRRR